MRHSDENSQARYDLNFVRTDSKQTSYLEGRGHSKRIYTFQSVDIPIYVHILFKTVYEIVE
jgi:hypothetical protein